jgi:acyl carrier protein
MPTLDEQEIWRRVHDVFVQFFDQRDLVLTPGTTAADVYGWDSLSNVELMIEIERAFNIRFSTGAIASLTNVGDLVSLIRQLVVR